jgi:SAM-dependent methyltransferase
MEEELKRFQIPPILAAEKKCLEKTLPHLRGYHLLLLGSHRKLSDLPPHCLHAVGLSPVCRSEKSSNSWIWSQYEDLAIRNNSIDAAIVPYLLEYCKNADELLKELHRSLIGEGKLFLWGFERFHPWCWFNAPKPRKALLLWEVKKLLDKADFSIEEIRHFHCGAIYFIVAQKHISTLTPLRVQWKKIPIFEREWARSAVKKTRG